MSAYTLAFAGCLVLAGRLGDILGHRPLFLLGLTWFSLWSLIIGWTNTPVFLSLSRALQGIGAGLTIPSALATLTTTFPPGPRRNQALAVFGACGASGMVVGTLVGGALGDVRPMYFFIGVGNGRGKKNSYDQELTVCVSPHPCFSSLDRLFV